MFKDSSYWFSQPALSLSRFDEWAAYGLLAGFAIGIIIWIGQWWIKHPVIRNLANRFKNLALTISIIGLIWLGFRYENTPIFGRRIWLAAVLLIGCVWFGFICKYLLMKFREEKKEYDFQAMNSKYVSGRRKS